MELKSKQEDVNGGNRCVATHRRLGSWNPVVPHTAEARHLASSRFTLGAAGVVFCRITFALSLVASWTKSVAQEQREEGLYPDLKESKERFKDYLKNPYPVQRVLFVAPAEGVRLDGQPLTGELVYQGSLEHETFYLRHLGDRPGQPEYYAGRWIISGRSRQGAVWTIDGDASRGTGGNINVTEPGSEHAAAQSEWGHEASMALHRLRMVTQFGLPQLVTESVKWSGDRFDALYRSDQWPHDTNTYPVIGEVLAYTNNLPLAIKLSSPDWPEISSHVEFHYDYDFDVRSYPVDIRSEVVLKDGRRGPGIRRRVLDIRFGKQEDVEGFGPMDFIPEGGVAQANIFVSSNKTIYWPHEGRLLEVRLPNHRSGGAWVRISVFALTTVILVLLAGIAGRFAIKRHKSKRTGGERGA